MYHRQRSGGTGFFFFFNKMYTHTHTHSVIRRYLFVSVFLFNVYIMRTRLRTLVVAGPLPDRRRRRDTDKRDGNDFYYYFFIYLRTRVF